MAGDVGGICGGFVVKNGKVVQCAPILSLVIRPLAAIRQTT